MNEKREKVWLSAKETTRDTYKFEIPKLKKCHALNFENFLTEDGRRNTEFVDSLG